MQLGQLGSKKLFVFLAALLLLAGFLTVFLHHHEDGYHFHDCSVCQFVGGLKAVALFLIVFAFFADKTKFFAISPIRFNPFSFERRLQSRAPPVLS